MVPPSRAAEVKQLGTVNEYLYALQQRNSGLGRIIIEVYSSHTVKTHTPARNPLNE